jgi:hypothetical protein
VTEATENDYCTYVPIVKIVITEKQAILIHFASLLVGCWFGQIALCDPLVQYLCRECTEHNNILNALSASLNHYRLIDAPFRSFDHIIYIYMYMRTVNRNSKASLYYSS